MLLRQLKGKIPSSLYSSLSKRGFSKLRPCQAKAIQAGLLAGKNIVVASPTASGKTLVGEIATLKAIFEGKGKAVYTVPLKALATQKYENFRQRYEPYNVRVALSIGDLDSADPFLARYDLIVCSNEKLDSLIRHGAPWLEDVAVIVVDEVHLLNDAERGPTLEVLITMLRQLLPNAQFVALSATIGNPKEIAGWLKAALVEDSWRPVKLYEGVSYRNKVDFYGKKPELGVERITGKDEIDVALDTIERNKQALIFVNAKRSAEALAEKIAKEVKKVEKAKELAGLSRKVLTVLATPTKQCKRLAPCIEKGIAFHHAGLPRGQRELIEQGFLGGLIDIIVCTPTLALGIEFPTDRAIIRDLRRYGPLGYSWIPVLEMKQFSGRCGRPTFKHAYGEAICVARTKAEKAEIADRYIHGAVEPILSKLAFDPVLRTYVLALIAIRFVRSKPDLENFFKRTFWAFQYKNVRKITAKLDKIIHFLLKCGFIKTEKRKVFPTKLGERVSQLYIDPLTARHLIRSAKKAARRGINEVGILQAISSCSEMAPLLRVSSRELEEYEAKLIRYEDLLYERVSEFALGYTDFLASFKTALMLRDWINEASEADLLDRYRIRPGDLNVKLTNGDWLLYCLEQLSLLTGLKEIISELAKLRVRLRYGIKEELLPLVRFKGIGRVRARALFNAGIRTRREVRKATFERLASLVGTKTAKSLKEQVEIKSS